MHERTAIYCRLSEEDQVKHGTESQSIQNQKQLLRQYAQVHGWTIVAEFCDDDYAGADRNRPAFCELLEGAEKGLYDIVLCKTQSRFTREMELVEHYIHDCFPRWGVRFVSVVDHADTAIRGNKKARQINGLINEWYLEDLSDNIRAVLTSRRKSGLHIGSTALYGYQKDPEKRGHLIPNPQTAWVVRQIFKWFLEGDSQRIIAERLNTQGVLSPAACKGKIDCIWSAGSVRTILHNEMYRGCLVQGRYGSESYKTRKNTARPKEQWYRVENTHEALVSEEQWKMVQQKLQVHTHPSHARQMGVFAGLVFCYACGAPLCVTSTRGKKYLQCAAHHAHKAACKGAFISEQALKEAIELHVRRFLAEYLPQKKQDMLKQSEKQDDGIQAECKQCEKQIAQYNKSVQMLYLDRVAGSIPEDTAQVVLEQLTRQKTQVETHMQVLKAKMQQEEQDMVWDGALDHVQVGHLIQRIEVGRREKGQNQVPVHVFWRF